MILTLCNNFLTKNYLLNTSSLLVQKKVSRIFTPRNFTLDIHVCNLEISIYFLQENVMTDQNSTNFKFFLFFSPY